jgi:site-specific DNA-methyltransferase (adenine-specific)
MEELINIAKITAGYTSETIGHSHVVLADCFDWLSKVPPSSLHAIVTDPPYGLKEYDLDQLEKRANGKGGIWRIPPSFDGNVRSPVPRFTTLSKQDQDNLREFFVEWARLIERVLYPGGHVFLAGNSLLSQLVFNSIVSGGLEFRGQLIRLVRTLRGGDRPKNAEQDFPEVCSLPRGCYEPWGIFRKSIPKNMKVSDCLRMWGTGGLRRYLDGKPFEDVIPSARTPAREKKIAPHPTLKPQSFLRRVVYASLPLGKGIIVDPFMGSGSTVAAAESLGLCCIGVDRNVEYYNMSKQAIPKLARLHVDASKTNKELRLEFDWI